MRLSVLLVEDDPVDLRQLQRDIPAFFAECNIEIELDPQTDFDAAMLATRSAIRRYDLIISDTYRGEHAKKDAAVLRMISDFRGGRFAPLIVFSSASKPAELEDSAFVRWADKGKAGDIQRAIRETINTGVPQLSRRLHDEIDRSAGSFLWAFLEENWGKLRPKVGSKELERIIRKRAALMIGDLDPDGGAPVGARHGFEYYVYPSFAQEYFSLGDVVKRREGGEFRVVLTPHCFLFPRSRESGALPKAEMVLTVVAVPAEDVIGKEKINEIKARPEPARAKKLASWARGDVGTIPEGRHWFLPAFLDIPFLYCDFLRVASLDQESLKKDFQRVATLTPPYAESLQEKFASFYGSVGIPDIDSASIASMLD